MTDKKCNKNLSIPCEGLGMSCFTNDKEKIRLTVENAINISYKGMGWLSSSLKMIS